MVLAMTFVIISGEIDLSVASMMGLGRRHRGHAVERASRPSSRSWSRSPSARLCGLLNGFLSRSSGCRSLAVTLAGYRLPRSGAFLVEDRSVGGFPAWFERLGQQPLVGPFPLSLLIFAVMLVGRHRGPALVRVRAATYVHRQQHPGRALLGRSRRARTSSRSSR